MRGIVTGLGLAQGSENSGSPSPPSPYSNTKSIVSDGVDEYLDCGTPADFGGTNQHFTVGVWFKTETNQDCSIMSKWGGVGSGDWGLYLTGGRVFGYLATSIGPANPGSAGTYNDGGWHLAVMSWDGTDVAIDIDGGADRVTLAASDRPAPSGANTIISGKDNGSGGANYLYFGHLDEVTFFHTGLSAAQCVELYNSGTPIDMATHSAYSDLVSWYRMGDAAGDSTDSADPASRVNDVKGGNDATPMNMDVADIVTDIPPTFNRLSLLTDGVDEYAELSGASVTGCDPDWNESWSVSVWVKTTAHSSTVAGYVASKITGAPSYTGWAVGFYLGNPFCFFSHGVNFGLYAQSYVDQFVTTGAWKHVVWTYDGSGTLAGGMKMYVNGLDIYPQGQVTQSYIDTFNGFGTKTGAGAPLRIGGTSYGEYFNGSFDELSIWSKELSAVEVDAMFNSGTPTDLTGSADLDAYYRCGEVPGDSATGTIHDRSGNSNDLVASNMEAGDIQSVTPRPFWNLLSIGFDGVDEHLYSSPAGNAPIYDRFAGFSVSLWVKTSSSTFGGLVTKQLGTGRYRGWGLYVNPTGSGEFGVQMYNTLGSNVINVETTANGWNDGDWHHVCLTYDGSSTAAGLKIAVDGVDQAMTVNADALSGTILNSTAMSIGSRGLANAFYNGRVDEVSLYSVILTTAQITELYNNGKPRDAQTLTTESYIDAYYRCGDDTFDAKAGGQATVFDKTVNDYDLWQANMEQADFDVDTP